MGCITRLMCIIVLLCAALVGTGEASQTVLFDTAHGEKFSIEDDGPLQLSHFAQVLRDSGMTITSGSKPLSDETLKAVDALVISGAFRPLSAEEVSAVGRYIQRGGKVCVMLHIAPPLQGLLDSLQVAYTNGAIQEQENVLDSPLHFAVTRLGDHPVLHGLKHFKVYGVWGVLNRSEAGRVIASTSPNAWVDLRHDGVQRKETTASFGIAVAGAAGKGEYLVFGDDALFQNKFLEGDNQTLAANLAKWLHEKSASPAPQRANAGAWI